MFDLEKDQEIILKLTYFNLKMIQFLKGLDNLNQDK